MNNLNNLRKRSLAKITAKLLCASACIQEVINTSREVAEYLATPPVIQETIRFNILATSNELHLVASGCHSQGTDHITLDGLALTYKGTLGLSTAFLGIATASYMLASAFDELLNRITSNSTVSASLLALDAVIGKCYTLVEATALASNLVREHPTQPHLNPYYGGTTETT